MEPSRGEDEKSVKISSNYSSDQGSICKCSIPFKCMDKLDIPTPIGFSQQLGFSEHVLGTVSRTESYLKERRIPGLIRFLLTKLLADGPDRPTAHLIKILDDCMLYRAGLGHLPVLYEERFVITLVGHSLYTRFLIKILEPEVIYIFAHMLKYYLIEVLNIDNFYRYKAFGRSGEKF